MFNEKLFRRTVEDCGYTLRDVASTLEIGIATLYRKMSGESDFYRREIQTIGTMLGKDNIEKIFFS
ncbi:MAG: XRE family transcriptional regulator [Oscillospiraceae bacterium]|nr:XRE family transcriptional regulator [Oscillospiraceae bacterium]